MDLLQHIETSPVGISDIPVGMPLTNRLDKMTTEQAKWAIRNGTAWIAYLKEQQASGVDVELVEYAALPEKYRSLDYLRPYYGHPDWGVRSIFAGYLGWFDGNPTSLFPLGPREQASRMAELAGGREALERAVSGASKAGQYQWALQLVDHLLRLSPNDRSLLLTKAALLDTMSEQMLNLTARNYFRSYAFELRTLAGS